MGELRQLLQAPPPQLGLPYEELLARVFTDVTPYRGRPDAAGYMAFVPGFTTWPSAMADLIASALNLDSCWWAGGAGMTQLELTVLEWFAEWIGYPADASGVLTSGGSAANLTALACARERLAGAMRDDLVVYISAQSHSSVARAARALGFRPERVRVVPVDRAYHLRLDVLERAVAGPGRRPEAARRVRQRGDDEHRRHRPAARPGRLAVPSTACGCTSTPPTAASPCCRTAGERRCQASSAPTP